MKIESWKFMAVHPRKLHDVSVFQPLSSAYGLSNSRCCHVFIQNSAWCIQSRWLRGDQLTELTWKFLAVPGRWLHFE